MTLPLIVHASRRLGVSWEAIAAALGGISADDARREYGEPEENR